MTSESPKSHPSERARKRAKYTQVAWWVGFRNAFPLILTDHPSNECKRRKLKCSGGALCARCSRDQIQCVYAASRSGVANETEPNDERCAASHQKGPAFLIPSSTDTRFQAMDGELKDLRREMRTLSARLHELESTAGAASPSRLSTLRPGGSLHRILDAPKSPTYVGPTSAEFGLSQPRRRSSQAGEETVADGHEEELDLSTGAAGPAPSERRGDTSTGDPLRSLGTDEALRLVQVYEDTVGVMYPCVDLEGVRVYCTVPPGYNT
jgi:hypothetical protein